MIARIWQGATRASQAEAYLDYLEATGVRSCRATHGNRGVFVFRRQREDRAEFLLLTLWETPEAIRRFAGPEMEKAVYYPEDASYLLELEPRVEHYKLVRWCSGRTGHRVPASAESDQTNPFEAPLWLPLERVRHL